MLTQVVKASRQVGPSLIPVLYTTGMSTSAASAAQKPLSAEEFFELVRTMLTNGEAGAARRAAAEGVSRYPDHPWLKKTDRVINPKGVVSQQADAPDRKREFAWLREHSGEYRGSWVALLGDRLLDQVLPLVLRRLGLVGAGVCGSDLARRVRRGEPDRDRTRRRPPAQVEREDRYPGPRDAASR